MARSRAENYDQARDAILTKAIALFAKQGYPSASMSALAKACHISKAGLYHYYPSKEALLFDALSRYTLRLKTLALTIASVPAEPKQRVRALIQGFLEEYQHSRNVHVVLLHDVEFLPDEQKRQIKATEKAVVNIFATKIQAAFPSQITPNNCKALTMSLLGAINFTFAWLREDGPVSYFQYGEWVSQVWLTGLDSANPSTNSSLV